MGVEQYVPVLLNDELDGLDMVDPPIHGKQGRIDVETAGNCRLQNGRNCPVKIVSLHGNQLRTLWNLEQRTRLFLRHEYVHHG